MSDRYVFTALTRIAEVSLREFTVEELRWLGVA